MPHYNVLFLCTGNSARAIMAEAIMNRMGSPNFTAYSAGSHPSGVVRLEALAEIAKAGLERNGLRSKSWDEFAVPGGAHPLRFRITGDLQTGRLLGAHVLGRWGVKISKRVDIFAAALFHEMTLDQVSDLDLNYTPPLSSPWNPVQMARQAWSLKSTEQRRETECAK